MSKDSSEQYRPLVRGTVIADRYEVEKYLGESLLGPTYVVRYIERNQLVAIKFIRNEYAPIEDLDEIKELMKKAKAPFKRRLFVLMRSLIGGKLA